MVTVKMVIPDDVELKQIMRKHIKDCTKNILRDDFDSIYDKFDFKEKIEAIVNSKFESSSWSIHNRIDRILENVIREQIKTVNVKELYEDLLLDKLKEKIDRRI